SISTFTGFAKSAVSHEAGTPPSVANKIGRRVSLGAVERLDRFAARREEACGRSDVDVRDEQPWFTVWLVAEQRPVGPHHRRSGRRPSACTVYSGEIAGVLGGATQGCFLME